MSKQERILLIVESPNKIASLKSFLPSNYIVMASVGHISEIKDGGSYWNTGIEPKDDFKTNFAVSPDKKDVVNQLKEQVKVADRVVIASDPDREGESIAWSLKKFLNIPNNKYERVTFHEITKSAVLKALENPRKIDEDLVDASHTRMKLDKMLGYRLSPIARKQVDARSVGRCQSAGLKLICDREHEIQDFVPQKYYELWLYFKKNNLQFKAKYIGTKTTKEDKLYDLDRVNKILEDCVPPFKILKVERKEKKEYPKAPFITSTFQQEVSSKLGISVKKAQEYAQKLFEGINVGGQHIALITYIRTDSYDISDEFASQLERFVKSEFGTSYYSPIKKQKNSENAQDGHECIRVIDLSMTPEKLSSNLSDKNLLKVYDIIYKRTLALMMKPCIISETIYTISCNNYLFEFSSKEEVFDGFKKVYRYDDNQKDEVIKETFVENEEIHVTSLDSEEKSTKPKSRFKEATFIKELESTGIGRPSTFATILSTLLDESRGYCTKEDEFIIPTKKGLKLSQFLDEKCSSIINVEYTSEMEKGLDLIAKGELDDKEFLTNFFTNLENTAQNCTKNMQRDSSNVQTIDRKCPECGRTMIIRTGPYGQFIGCSGFPKCKHIERIEEDGKKK